MRHHVSRIKQSEAQNAKAAEMFAGASAAEAQLAKKEAAILTMVAEMEKRKASIDRLSEEHQVGLRNTVFWNFTAAGTYKYMVRSHKRDSRLKTLLAASRQRMYQ